MIVIKDAYKVARDRVCIRSKYGVWCTLLSSELEAVIGHTGIAQTALSPTVSTAKLRLDLNGRLANLNESDFYNGNK